MTNTRTIAAATTTGLGTGAPPGLRDGVIERSPDGSSRRNDPLS